MLALRGVLVSFVGVGSCDPGQTRRPGLELGWQAQQPDVLGPSAVRGEELAWVLRGEECQEHGALGPFSPWNRAVSHILFHNLDFSVNVHLKNWFCG